MDQREGAFVATNKSEQHDFEALRAERNRKHDEWVRKFCAEHDFSPAELQTNFNPDACYCACGTGGPCEHRWDGEEYISEDGCLCSATCSRCGMTAFSHSMRYAP